jgi:hypothetical protein
MYVCLIRLLIIKIKIKSTIVIYKVLKQLNLTIWYVVGNVRSVFNFK